MNVLIFIFWKDISQKVKLYFWLFPLLYCKGTIWLSSGHGVFLMGSLPHSCLSFLMLGVTRFPGCVGFVCCLWKTGRLERACAAVSVCTRLHLLSFVDLSSVLPNSGMFGLVFLHLSFLIHSCLTSVTPATQKHACLLFPTCRRDSAFVFLTSFFIPQIGSFPLIYYLQDCWLFTSVSNLLLNSPSEFFTWFLWLSNIPLVHVYTACICVVIHICLDIVFMFSFKPPLLEGTCGICSTGVISISVSISWNSFFLWVSFLFFVSFILNNFKNQF